MPETEHTTTLEFEGLGTKWQLQIISQTKPIPNSFSKKIAAQIDTFEHSFSRFKPRSLVAQLNTTKELDWSQPPAQELKRMILFGQKIEKISQGHFSLQIGRQLAKLGYGHGPQGLDLGSFGKGWLADQLAETISTSGYQHFLINAGGDILASSKPNHHPWQVGLEHPLNPKQIIGQLAIKNQAIAASGPAKRSWKKNGQSHHHLVALKSPQSVQRIETVFVQAQDARTADAVATALAVSPPVIWPEFSKKLKIEYAVISNQKKSVSAGFPGSFFKAED